MKIADVQNAIASGCQNITNSATHAARWIGHSVQAIGAASLDAAKKAGDIGLQVLCKAGQLAQTGGLAAWNFTKSAGNKTAEIVTKVGNGIISGTQTTGTAIVDLSQKVAKVAGHALSRTAQVVGNVLVGAKDGAVAGFQASRSFLIAHQKETLVAGVALTIGLAIGYAATRAYNTQTA